MSALISAILAVTIYMAPALGAPLWIVWVILVPLLISLGYLIADIKKKT